MGRPTAAGLKEYYPIFTWNIVFAKDNFTPI